MNKVAPKNISIAELEALVRKHNRLYFVEHKPEISDYEFDRLVEELKSRKPKSSALIELTSDFLSVGEKVKHKLPMLSLDKCYDEKTLVDWASKFEGEIVASPKIDGCAVSIHYDDRGNISLAATRGDGVEGEEITANVRYIKTVPKNIRLHASEVRGEVYMPLSVFERYRGEFSNPRNLAAGAIKQKDPKKTGEYTLSFFAYDLLNTKAKSEDEKYALLKKEGFSVVEWKKLSKQNMPEAYEEFLGRRNEFDFETDGVVFKTNDADEQKRLGVTAHHPRYAIAYKFQGDSGTTKLLDVEWSVSRTGAITPIAVVEPVLLSGALVRRASLHNIAIMKSLGISRGAEVLMMRRGGVIPNLESVVKSGRGSVEIPKKCPSCDAPTILKDDFLYCTRPKECVQSKVGELSHFVKTVGIDGFGEKLLFGLYESGIVTDPSELYELTKDDLLQMERMGDVLATKLLSNIESHTTMPLEVFLQSLGIRELGKHAAKLLAAIGNLKKLLSLSEEDLSQIHTIGPVIACEVVEGFQLKRVFIDKLLRHIKIVETKNAEIQSGPAGGKTFLFTGSLLSMERKSAELLVQENGGENLQSVSKALDFLVVGDGGGAGSKLDKAKKQAGSGGKIKIISEKEFLKMMGK